MAATTNKPVSVILCGQGATTGRPVAQYLKPEYEVISFINTVPDGVANIPKILDGTGEPDLPNDDVGTRNFTEPPQAVLLGGAFSKEMVEEMRAACQGTITTGGVPWLMRGPNAAQRLPPPGPDYPAAVVNSIKAVLAGLKKDGKMGRDGLYTW